MLINLWYLKSYVKNGHIDQLNITIDYRRLNVTNLVDLFVLAYLCYTVFMHLIVCFQKVHLYLEWHPVSNPKENCHPCLLDVLDALGHLNIICTVVFVRMQVLYFNISILQYF